MFLKRSKLFYGFFFSLSLFVTQLCFAEEPYLELKENSFDFGKVDEGSVIEHSFVVKNNGNADLRIEKVVTGCNCLEDNYSNILILPSEEKEFHIKLDTTGLSGKYDRKIRFFTNEGGRSFSSFSIKGFINPLIKIEPAIIDFAEIVDIDDSSKIKSLKISLNRKSSIEILKVESYSKAIQVQELGGDKFEKTYEVKLNGKLPLGEYRGRIIASFSNGKSINIPVIALVHSLIEFDPKVISFGDLSGKKAVVKKSVSVINRSRGKCKITDIDSSSSLVDASLEGNDGTQVVIVQINPRDLKRSINEKLVLESDCEQLGNFVIGVHSFYKRKAS